MEGTTSDGGGCRERKQNPKSGVYLQENTIGDRGSDSAALTADTMLRYFEERSRHLKQNTIREYSRSFGNWAKTWSQNAISKRWMARKGRRSILDWINTVQPGSRRVAVAGVKSVLRACDYPWPVDIRNDLKNRFAKTQRRTTPPDHVIADWKAALGREFDLRRRLVIRLILQTGIRPEQARKLKARNIVRGPDGAISHIDANGRVEDFKRSSRLLVRVSPDLAADLELWMAELGPLSSSDRLLPYVGGTPGVRRRFNTFSKRQQLPFLLPSEVRHWVATAARRAGLSRTARAMHQGWDPQTGGSMAEYYDAPSDEDILAEQAQLLPLGPLGVIAPPVQIEYEPESLLNTVREALESGAIDPGQLQLLLLRVAAKGL